MDNKIKTAYAIGYREALKHFKLAGNGMTGAMSATPNSSVATHQQNMSSVPLAPPMPASPVAGATNAFMGGKPFSPIPQTPGVKPAS